MTDQPRHPRPRPGARHPRRPLPARRALSILGALLLSLAAAATAAPAASATPPPLEPPVGLPPPPPTVTAPGLPLWGRAGHPRRHHHPVRRHHPHHPGAATRHTGHAPAIDPRTMHQPLPPARPATRQHTSAAIPAKETGS